MMGFILEYRTVLLFGQLWQTANIEFERGGQFSVQQFQYLILFLALSRSFHSHIAVVNIEAPSIT